MLLCLKSAPNKTGPFEARPNARIGCIGKNFGTNIVSSVASKKNLTALLANMATWQIKLRLGGGAWNEVISLVGEFKEKTDACGEVL